MTRLFTLKDNIILYGLTFLYLFIRMYVLYIEGSYISKNILLETYFIFVILTKLSEYVIYRRMLDYDVKLVVQRGRIRLVSDLINVVAVSLLLIYVSFSDMTFGIILIFGAVVFSSLIKSTSEEVYIGNQFFIHKSIVFVIDAVESIELFDSGDIEISLSNYTEGIAHHTKAEKRIIYEYLTRMMNTES